MSTKERKRRIAIAYHEAGHIVAQLLSEYADDPESATIREQDLVFGHAEHQRFPVPIDLDMLDELLLRAQIEDQIVVTLAGGAAEMHFTGVYNNVGARRDLHQAVTLAGHVVEEEVVENFLRYLSTRSETLVETHADAIEAVANRLLEREMLTLDEIREAVDS